jgi:hypothetical protein
MDRRASFAVTSHSRLTREFRGKTVMQAGRAYVASKAGVAREELVGPVLTWRDQDEAIVNGRRKNGHEGADNFLKNQTLLLGLDGVSQSRGAR